MKQEINKRLYSSWAHMKYRCNNKNSQRFHRYGGRGIEVCKEWNNSFNAFEKWAYENGYKDGLTIDRIDSDGNYTPVNCQWIPLRDNSGKHGTPSSKAETPRENRHRKTPVVEGIIIPMKIKTMKQSLSVKDIQDELGCSPNHARSIVLNELPHIDISARGNRPTWRVRRKDFESWMAARREAPGLERLEEFAKQYTR